VVYVVNGSNIKLTFYITSRDILITWDLVIAFLYSRLFERLVHKMIKVIKLDYKLQRMSCLNTAVNENISNESTATKVCCWTQFSSLSLLAGHERDRKHNIRTVSAVTYQL